MLSSINWTKPTDPVTVHFSVHDCTYLPTWGVYHTASDAERAAMLDLCVRMEKVRGYLGGQPINVHCILRPNKLNCPDSVHHGQDYNAAIGSTAKHSPHIMGMAIDFDVKTYTCDEVRAKLTPYLAQWGFRMEDAPGSSWVHLDTYSPSMSGGQRLFKP